MTQGQVMQNWVTNANEGRIKIGKRELTNDELALIGDVLRCVSGDLSICLPDYVTGSDGLRYTVDDPRCPG